MEHRLSPIVIVPTRQNTAFVARDLRVEVSVLKGLQNLSLTGLPNDVLRDARDKIRAILHNSVSWDPLERLVVHMAPQELQKAGSHIELAIIVACWVALQADLRSDPEILARLIRHRFYGSVDLSGRIVRTPTSDFLEADDLESIGPRHFSSLSEIFAWIGSKTSLPQAQTSYETKTPSISPEIIHVEGRLFERFALLIAAILREPILLVGPPGVGKTHLGQWCRNWYRSPSETHHKEALRIWRSSGHEVAPEVPYMNPHARTHISEFIGHKRGGRSYPGLFSLAHGGLMVLDEFPELARDVREIFRNVLDQREIKRLDGQDFVAWPADFWLVATANPCACGHARPNDLLKCRCSRGQLTKYLDRFSGPLLDRFGIQLFMHETSNPTLKSIMESREMQDIRTIVEGDDLERRDFIARCRLALETHKARPGASRRSVQVKRIALALEAAGVPNSIGLKFLDHLSRPFLDERSFR